MATTSESIVSDFRTKVSEQIRLHPQGLNRFAVATPFTFDDGDHLVIVLKKVGTNWILSDEGHTMMRLSYELDERDLAQGNRAKIIDSSLGAFGIKNSNGIFSISIPDERYGDALFSFIQAIMKVSDVTFLNRERVRSTFLEDFKDFIADLIPENRRTFDWNHPIHDPEGMYPVDCYVNGMARPLGIFALPSDDRARDTTITLLQVQKWVPSLRSVCVFEEQEAIHRKVLARLSDACDKQFSSLYGNKDRLRAYLDAVLSEPPFGTA